MITPQIKEVDPRAIQIMLSDELRGEHLVAIPPKLTIES